MKIRYLHYSMNLIVTLDIDFKYHQTDLADVLSVLAMTMGKEGERESLKYKLEASKEPVGSWGHEYVRYVLNFIKFFITALRTTWHIFSYII